MDSTRQQRIAKLIQKDLAEIFQTIGKNQYPGTLLSVTKVRVTPDLSLARVYISIFPTKNAAEIMGHIKDATTTIRHQLAQEVKHQLRKVPELLFFLDDSNEYEENIDRLLRGEGDNPIQ
ncbi:MAG: 30S ribosome-binding factor RbfA [Bacteroidota bacterium]|nr:30S ribosome-binding factor RbfA [Bacteroidota bacterium]MDX5429099.1 30S ribosome-binding factor RbfA [Bacteroidota bacterium]MDX5448814.1 30S ribosome-binding factor RbfA [Bacteroidota bacterium]MDX5506748.1 30S ribosome-binding factor RbfA [Bacteroidota bacterium]